MEQETQIEYWQNLLDNSFVALFRSSEYQIRYGDIVVNVDFMFPVCVVDTRSNLSAHVCIRGYTVNSEHINKYEHADSAHRIGLLSLGSVLIDQFWKTKTGVVIVDGHLFEIADGKICHMKRNVESLMS